MWKIILTNLFEIVIFSAFVFCIIIPLVKGQNPFRKKNQDMKDLKEKAQEVKEQKEQILSEVRDREQDTHEIKQNLQ